MIYIAFTFWLFALLFVSRGIVKLWTGRVNPKIISWIILPGTLVAELSYYLASLLSGAEFRPRKLVDDAEGETTADKGAGKGVPYLTPLLTGLLPIVAALGLILLISSEFGHPVFASFNARGIEAPIDLPLLTEATIWDLLAGQAHLMGDAAAALGDALGQWPWDNPVAWLFEYLMICLILRLAPHRRPMRPALAAAAVVAMATAATVAIVSPQAQWLYDIWPLISYTWATALLLLMFTLCVRAVIALAEILAGKE